MALFQVKKKSKKREEDNSKQKKRKSTHKKSKKKTPKEISISSDSSQEVEKKISKKKRSKRPRNESSSIASSSILSSVNQPQASDVSFSYPFWKLHLAQVKGTARTDPQEAERLTHAMKHIQRVYDNKDKQRSILGRLFKAKLSYENSDFDKKQALDCFLMNNHVGAKDIVLKIVEKQRVHNENKGGSVAASSPDKSLDNSRHSAVKRNSIDNSRHTNRSFDLTARSAYSTAYGHGRGVRPLLGKQLSIFKKGISERTEFDHSVADEDSVASSMTEEDHVADNKREEKVQRRRSSTGYNYTQTPKRSNTCSPLPKSHQKQQPSLQSSSFPYPLGIFDHIDLNAMEWLPIDTHTSTLSHTIHTTSAEDEASNASDITPNTVTSQQIDEMISQFKKQKSARRHTIPYGSSRQLKIPNNKEQSSRTTETSDTSESPRDVMRRIEQKWKKDVDLLQVSRSTNRTTETARQRRRRLERAHHVRSR
ncbi:predicted protein [Chaetoceros tenuissimus]|uniref:Uncharacterized protein n=1 Tax=Chaetoceros tenuissimus TaxID=426638 RepID=A0AAD3GZE4_9STRA|nr:predicted protein [Chaetoceros tenuissimus]